MTYRTVTVDPNPPFPAHRLGIVKRHLKRRWWRCLSSSFIEEQVYPATARFEGKTDYEDYVRRLFKNARERAMRRLIEEEAEESDDESESDLEDEDVPHSFEEYLEDEDVDEDDDDGENDNDDADGEDDNDYGDSEDDSDDDNYSAAMEEDYGDREIDYEELFGSDWEYDGSTIW